MNVVERWILGPKKFKILNVYYTIGEKCTRRPVIEFGTVQYNVAIFKDRNCIVFAPAGLGKSQIVRQCGKDVHAGRLKQLQGRTVITIDLAGLSKEKEYLPQEALVGSASALSMEKGFQWMRDHSEQFIFFVGALSELPFPLEKEFPAVDFDKVTTIDVIFHNLFTGKIFPKSYVFATCGRNKAFSYVPKPGSGMTAKKLNGEDIINYTKLSNPKLWPLMTDPDCTRIAVGGFDTDTDFVACTLTGIFVKRALKELQDNPGREEQYISLIDKFKGLAYNGMSEGEISLSDSDLQHIGLSRTNLEGFQFLVPTTNRFKRLEYYDCMEEDFLAALHMMSIDMGGFNEYMDDKVENTYYSVVRRCLCGLLYDDKVRKVAKRMTKVEFQHLAEKRKIVTEYLHKGLLRNFEDLDDKLQIFVSVFECQDGLNDIIKSCVDKIIFTDHPIIFSDIQAVWHVVQRCKFLSQLVLIDCKLDDCKVECFAEYMLESDVKMDLLDISCNSDLEPKSLYRIAKIIEHCEVKKFSANSCDLRPDHMKQFVEGIGQARVDVINFGSAPKIGAEGIYEIGRICSLCEVKHLHIFQSGVKRHFGRFVNGHASVVPRLCEASSCAAVGES